MKKTIIKKKTRHGMSLLKMAYIIGGRWKDLTHDNYYLLTTPSFQQFPFLRIISKRKDLLLPFTRMTAYLCKDTDEEGLSKQVYKGKVIPEDVLIKRLGYTLTERDVLTRRARKDRQRTAIKWGFTVIANPRYWVMAQYGDDDRTLWLGDTVIIDSPSIPYQQFKRSRIARQQIVRSYQKEES